MPNEKNLKQEAKTNKQEKTLAAIKQVLNNASINILVADNLYDDVFRGILCQTPMFENVAKIVDG